MRCVVVALAIVALAVPGAGVGKAPLTAIRVCGAGAGACGESRDPHTLEALRTAFAPDVRALGATPELGPYVELRGGSEWPEHLGYFVPGSDVIQWGWPGAVRYWVQVDAPVRAELERVAATVQPRPRPTLVRVIVNGRVVRNPGAYLALFRPLQRAPRPRASGPIWIPVTFLWKATNPWAGDDSTMLYDLDDRALLRSGTWYRVPRLLGRMIARPAYARR